MSGNEKTWSPIVFDEVDPRIRSLGGKSPEEKTYIVLFYLTSEDGDSAKTFDICIGREECYRSIERTMYTYNVDIDESIVMVDIPCISATGTAEWAMKHPDNALSIYQFCKTVEGMFGGSFRIDDFATGERKSEDVTVDRIKSEIDERSTAVKSEAEVFEGDSEMVRVYKEAMESK